MTGKLSLLTRRWAFAALLAMLLLPLAQPLSAAPADDVRVKTALAMLDAWIGAQQQYRNIPSISVSVVHGQDLIWAKSWGLADPDSGRRASPDTVYRVASNSKLFTALAIMKLEEEAKLSVRDPVLKWIPELAGMKNSLGQIEPMTVWHLLTHTSGLPREANQPYWAEKDFPAIEAVLAGLGGQRAIFAPGVRLKYSNLGLALAGHIVERASGQTYEDYLEARFFQPLGMVRTGLEAPLAAAAGDLAIGYGRRMPDGSRERHAFTPTNGLAPATGLYSTVRDFARFQSWQLRLRNASKAEILKPETLLDMQKMHWILPGRAMGWGLGFRIWNTSNGFLIGHGGLIHGFSTATGILPADRLGITVFASSSDADAQGFLNQIADLLVPAVRDAVEDEKKPSPTPEHWKKLTGLYRSGFADVEVIIGDGILLAVRTTGANPASGLARLVPLSDTEFRVHSSYSGVPGETAVFTFDGSGRVKRLYMGVNYLERVR